MCVWCFSLPGLAGFFAGLYTGFKTALPGLGFGVSGLKAFQFSGLPSAVSVLGFAMEECTTLVKFDQEAWVPQLKDRRLLDKVRARGASTGRF